MQLPLVIETGESFVTNRQVIRYIRDKCGDAIADYVGEFLGEDTKSMDTMELLKKIRRCLGAAENDILEAGSDIDRACNMMEEAGVF